MQRESLGLLAATQRSVDDCNSECCVIAQLNERGAAQEVVQDVYDAPDELERRLNSLR